MQYMFFSEGNALFFEIGYPKMVLKGSNHVFRNGSYVNLNISTKLKMELQIYDIYALRIRLITYPMIKTRNTKLYVFSPHFPLKESMFVSDFLVKTSMEFTLKIQKNIVKVWCFSSSRYVSNVKD